MLFPPNLKVGLPKVSACLAATFFAVLCSVDRKAFAPVSRNWIREVKALHERQQAHGQGGIRKHRDRTG